MKSTSLMILAFVLIASFSFVLADSNSSVNSSDNSIVNVSVNQSVNSSDLTSIDASLNQSVGSFDIFKQKFGLWFTFDQEKKAEGELRLARLYLVQARIAAKNNDSEAMQKALDAHNAILLNVQNRVGNLSVEGNANVTTEKFVSLERAIQVHEATIARWNALLDNENLTEEQKAKIEDRIQHAENVTNNLQEIQSERLDKIKTKLMVSANLTSEQADAVIATLKLSRGEIEAERAAEISKKQQEIQREMAKKRMEIEREAQKKLAEQNRENRSGGESDNEDESNISVDSESDVNSNESSSNSSVSINATL